MLVQRNQALPAWAKYGLTLLMVAAATWLRLLMDPWLSENAVPYVTFNAAVALTAFLWGRGPGIAATVASGLACVYFIIPPRYSILVNSAAEMVPMAFFIVAGLVVSLLAGHLHATGNWPRSGPKRSARARRSFKVIASSTPDHLLVQDRDLKYIFVINPQLGLKEQDMLGKTDHDFLTPADADNLTNIKRQVLATGNAVRVEVPLVSPAGEAQFFNGSYVPKYDARGRIDGLIGYFQNVTDRKLAEEALRQANAQIGEAGLRTHPPACRRQCRPAGPDERLSTS